MTERVILLRERPPGRLLPAASLAAILAVGVLSCTHPEDRSVDPAPAPEPAPAAGPTPTRMSAATSAAPDPTTPTETCVDVQRRAVRGLRTWKAIAAVTSSETGFSAAGAQQVLTEADRASERVEVACDGVPPAARRYLRDVRRAADADNFGQPQLDRVLAAWLRWGRAVDHPRPAERATAQIQACRALMRDLSVAHRIWWRRTGTGRAWWIELIWDNRTGRTVNGDVSGEIRVTGLLPDRFGWSASAASAGPGRTGTEGWGGSSSDMVSVQPGVSRQVIAPGIDQDVHTTADGTITITDNEVFLYVPGPGLNTCWHPVPERS